MLSIQSDQIVFNNEESIPSEIADISSIPALRGIKAAGGQSIRSLLKGDQHTPYSRQLHRGHGLNNAFLFSEHALSDCFCSLSDSSGIYTLRMFSDAPAVVVYSSGSMPDGIPLENDQFTQPGCSIAFEFQQMPTVQQPDCTLPGKDFTRTIIFCLERHSI